MKNRRKKEVILIIFKFLNLIVFINYNENNPTWKNIFYRLHHGMTY